MGCWDEGYEVVGVEEGHAGVDLCFEKAVRKRKRGIERWKGLRTNPNPFSLSSSRIIFSLLR